MKTQSLRFQPTCMLTVPALAGLVFLLAGTLTSTSIAEETRTNSIELTLENSSDHGIAAPDQPITFTAEVGNLTNHPQTVALTWSVNSVQLSKQLRERIELLLPSNQTKRVSHTLKLNGPGFAEVQCRVSVTDAKESLTRRSRFGCQPRSVTSSLSATEEFAKFWNTGLSELGEIPPAFEVVEHPDQSDERILVYEVAMRSHGQTRVRGWLEVPRHGRGPFPAVLRVPGYGQNMRPIGRWDDMIVFSFNPRGHGNSQQDVPGTPVDYWVRGLDDPNTYYYKGSYLDCIRAVDFLASRTDVDQDKLAVWGGSQGGGFALATASLDDRIDQCVADIPFLCDWVHYFQLTDWPEMNDWIADNQKRNWDSTLETLSYFDTMNLADRIKCPTIMAIGLQDEVCPPTTCFAVFNRIRADKTSKIYPYKGHGLGREHSEWVWTRLRRAFELTPNDQ